MMAIKKTKKRFSKEIPLEIDNDIIVSEIEKSSKKSLYCNFKICNKFKFNDVHQTFVDLVMMDTTKIVFIDGPAGSAKSYLSVYIGLQMLKAKQISQIIYLRSIIESSSKSIGALKGFLADKFEPYTEIMKQKLDEIVGGKVGEELIKNEYIKCMPVNFIRGLTFKDALVIVDESQNLDSKELTTILTRFGENSKFVIIGDSFQADIGNKSGFSKIRQAFDDIESEEKGIHSLIFGENEIVRSEILKFIVKKLENLPLPTNH
jgi:phosphate starvation-inducible PhoH-like protein